MIVNLNDSMYEMSNEEFKGLVDAAKNNFINKNAIVAICKGGHSVMMKQTFISSKLLYKEIDSYRSKGFKVYYTKKVK